MAAHIAAEDISEEQISLRAVSFNPSLPQGLSVHKCTAVILALDAVTDLQNLRFGLSIKSKVLGRPCSGQCLDAQEWTDSGRLVVVGTEDGESLNYRFPNLGLDSKNVIDYANDSMTLVLSGITEMKRPSFHFIVAENDDPEPADISAWLAVDQPHAYLLRQ